MQETRPRDRRAPWALTGFDIDRRREYSILADMPASKFRLRGSQRLADAVMGSLGELERKSVDEVRRRGETNVAGVCAALDNRYAYTTVMTTLDRLFKKGLLSRRKHGRAFLYSAKYSLEEMEHGMAEDVIGRLFESTTGRVEPVLACIVDSVSQRDLVLLDELERLVKAKKLELEKEK